MGGLEPKRSYLGRQMDLWRRCHDSRDDLIEAAYAYGFFSVSEIAGAMGLRRETVREALAERNVPMRNSRPVKREEEAGGYPGTSIAAT